jgi:cell division protease FtsH
MSFVPNPSRGTGTNPVARNLIFWVLMILLAVVLWQMAAGRGSRGAPAQALNYSDFMKQVDASNVESAHFELSENTAGVTGSLKQPAGRYSTTVPRESAANLMNTLRSNGVDVAVVEAPTALDTIKTIGPIVVLVIFWIFVMRQKMRSQQSTGSPGQPSPGALG